MTKPPAAERPRLTLEDYILFFTTHSGNGITIDLLNQILFMHGFNKCHRSNKSLIVDALNSLDLLRPRRSTFNANATAPPPPPRPAAAAVLSTEDVTRDIEDLGWRACPVGSVLSIRAGASHVPLATVPPAALMPPPAAPGMAAKRKRGPTGKGKAAIERRERRMADLLTLPSVEDISAEWQREGGVASAMV